MAKIIRFQHDCPAYEARIDYVLGFIENHPLVDGQIKFDRVGEEPHSLTLYYGAVPQKDTVFIPAQRLIFKPSFSAEIDLWANPVSFENYTLYVLAGQPKKEEVFFQNNTFNVDWIETIFFHLSRLEEHYCLESEKDDWDAMRSERQYLVRHNLQQIPVVDHLVFCLARALGVDLKPQRTAFRITHDIDAIEKNASWRATLRASAGVLVRGQHPNTLLRLWQTQLQGGNPYDTFDWMLRKETSVEKVIYFLGGGKTDYDTPFDLQHVISQKAIARSLENGYSVGIHPSYACWDDAILFQQEKEGLEALLGKEMVHSRQHYLHFSWEKTPAILEKSTIQEDSTLGFNDRIGFRCGTGFAYHLYNFEKEKAYSFTEMPLVWMDSAFFKEWNYHPKKIEQAWQQFLKQNEFLTKITFNFHNTRFYDAWLHHIPLRKMYASLF